MINPSLNLEVLKEEFLSSEAKYVVIDGLFDPSFIKKCEGEFMNIPDSEYVRYSDPHFEFEKYALNSVEKMPDRVREVFGFIHSQEFIDFVSSIVDLSPLLVDEKRWGGGLHKTKKGGYLSIHKDFTVLPTSYKDEEQMLRCINLIGYLNSNWKEEDGGHLEFWDSEGEKVVAKVPIKFNRWVIFDTRNNYHGHPIPYQGETSRISIASYYYTREKIEGSKWSSTEYLKLPWMEDTEEYQEKRKERSNHEKRYGSFLK